MTTPLTIIKESFIYRAAHSRVRFCIYKGENDKFYLSMRDQEFNPYLDMAARWENLQHLNVIEATHLKDIVSAFTQFESLINLT